MDKLPSEDHQLFRGKYLIEAEVYGDGIKMWLLSQGVWVKVIELQEFVEEIKTDMCKILLNYSE